MRNFTLTVLAFLTVLLLAVGGVAAHGSNDTASNHERVPENASAAEWGAWMEQHMTEHMGAGAAAQMREQMGMSYEEMGEHMTSNRNGSTTNGRMMAGEMNGTTDGMMSGGMSGMGCH